MKKFIIFSTIIQALKWLAVTIFFITEKPSLLFYLQAGIVEYIINVSYVKIYYKKYFYSFIISIPIIKTAIPSYILGQAVPFKKYLKFKKPHLFN